MTLKELLKGKELPVKVTHKYLTKKYITITAYNIEGCLYSVFDCDGMVNFSSDANNWKLYTEPKPKKVLHGYLVFNCEEFYESDELFLRNYEDHKIIKTGRTIEVEL